MNQQKRMQCWQFLIVMSFQIIISFDSLCVCLQVVLIGISNYIGDFADNLGCVMVYVWMWILVGLLVHQLIGA